MANYNREQRRCTAIKANGQPCQAWARRDDAHQRCASHPIKPTVLSQAQSSPDHVPVAVSPAKQPSQAIWLLIGLGILIVLVAGGISGLLVIGGFLTAVLGFIGIVGNRVPVLNIQEKRKAAALLIVGLCVWITGAAASKESPKALSNFQSTVSSSLPSSSPSPPVKFSDASQTGNSGSSLNNTDKATQETSQATQRLALAKKALADGYKPKGKNPSWGNLDEARSHLEKITATDKEYAQAQKLLAEVSRRETEREKATERQSRAESSSTLSNDNYYTNRDGQQVHSPAYSDSVPSGASAECRDGTYSFSQNRRGTCSHHGGVKRWL